MIPNLSSSIVRSVSTQANLLFLCGGRYGSFLEVSTGPLLSRMVSGTENVATIFETVQ